MKSTFLPGKPKIDLMRKFINPVFVQVLTPVAIYQSGFVQVRTPGEIYLSNFVWFLYRGNFFGSYACVRFLHLRLLRLWQSIFRALSGSYTYDNLPDSYTFDNLSFHLRLAHEPAAFYPCYGSRACGILVFVQVLR
jgi:hypothetical protein